MTIDKAEYYSYADKEGGVVGIKGMVTLSRRWCREF
jgi:hypothetical protein